MIKGLKFKGNSRGTMFFSQMSYSKYGFQRAVKIVPYTNCWTRKSQARMNSWGWRLLVAGFNMGVPENCSFTRDNY